MAEHACGFLVRAAAVLIVWVIGRRTGGFKAFYAASRLRRGHLRHPRAKAQPRAWPWPKPCCRAESSEVRGKAPSLVTIASAISDDPLADFLGIEAATRRMARQSFISTQNKVVMMRTNSLLAHCGEP